MTLSPAESRSRLFGYVLANHKYGDFHPPRVFVELALIAGENAFDDSDLIMEFVDGALAGYNNETIVIEPPTLMAGFDPLHQDAWIAGLAWGEKKNSEQYEWEKLPTYTEFREWLNSPFDDEEEEELEMLR